MPNRGNIRTNLQTQLTDVGTFSTRVYIGKEDAIPEGNLPAARVFTAGEEIEIITKRPRRYRRTLDLVVEGYDKPSTTEEAEERLDTLTEAVEKALSMDRTLGGHCKDSYPAGIEYELTGEGNKVIGVARVSVFCEYETVENET